MSEINKLENKIIVSVQAEGNEPLNTSEHLLAISQSVINGGAGGLRLCGVKNINYIKKNVSVPVVGLTKLEPTPINWLDKVYITATMKDLKELLKIGIDFIAIDGTDRPREDSSTLKDQISLVKNEGKIVICDIATFEDGINACKLGADIISTTLSGYTKDTRYKINTGPDFNLLAELTEESLAPVIMEGRIWEPQDVKKAFEIGAYAVVIGTAITRPQVITKRFASMAPD
ncbi:MAG: N-acetylmannosamine-6-phosphate 2-epimerase [Candidatus Melainabacteria bacterium]|nr:N-acetylmannosamine-6-phosphate 2-epimerase [Candidatus Melainabacteria bacterium]